ncbi:hypothetical protein [Sphingomonas sp. LT1P40]|uniref:hypothetical protein n=1 Tax=Alteristakelama amylovorans TaxID=3096166 RepID=UPI002FC5AE12
MNGTSPARRIWALSERRRKFAREVGSVVLGVLIALAAAEAVEWLRWQWRVQRSFEAVKEELAQSRSYLLERRSYQPCLERRIAAIGAILADARQTGRLPAIENVGRPGMRPIVRTAFDVATGEGVLLHTSRQTAAAYSDVYVLAIDAYQEQIAAEQEAWMVLGLLNQDGGPVSDDLLATLLEAWARARERGDWTGLIAQQGSDAIGELGVGYWTVNGSLAEAITEVEELNRKREVCKPMLVDGKPFRPAR